MQGFILFDKKQCLTSDAHRAYAAGEMNSLIIPQYKIHIEDCVRCKEESARAIAARKAYEVRRDGIILYVSGHLTDNAIEAYVNNNLPERLRMSLEGHAKICENCSIKLTEIAARSGVLLENL